ncbi:MAG: alpha-galactosidase, partial [Flavobacterium sp.]|nr:alpha-galactosidase [Flavobacterium sp.]
MNKLLFFLIIIALFARCSSKKDSIIIAKSDLVKISVINTSNSFWEYTLLKTNKTFSIQAPEFEIDGKLCSAVLTSVKLLENPLKLKNGVTETTFEGNLQELPDVALRVTFQVSDKNPILKFRYELFSESEHRLTKTTGKDQINYFSVSFNGISTIKEIRFSEFNEMVHSFCLSEREIEPKHFSNSSAFMGPLLIGSDGSNSFLIGYEHGSQVPDRFLEFRLNPDRSVVLQAVKGNYYNNYRINKTQSYRTIWFEAGAVAGDENLLAATYRDFVLHYMSPNPESRKPYIFYNTWNFQERNRNWYKKPYLADMTLERMLMEIDVAHQMGIEVFVIDAGWFEKTGDWTPSLKRFPDGLKMVKSKLDGYGMKLGLWFDPNAAA